MQVYHVSRYGGWGLKYTEADMSDLASATAAIKSAAAANSGRGRLVVWLETPSNPQTKVTDIAAVAAVAHSHGAVVVVDSTWVTPWICTPLTLGADIVMHSLTKCAFPFRSPPF